MILTNKQEQGLHIAIDRYNHNEAWTCIGGYDTIYHISCSNCKKPSPGQGQYNYCPHCGAEKRKANE